MKSITLRFDAAGDGHCLYTEALNLSSIGFLEITRASNIEFNPTRQEWEVRDTANQILYSNPSRSACLDWEQQHFNR
jgi:hypothetical protein